MEPSVSRMMPHILCMETFSAENTKLCHVHTKKDRFIHEVVKKERRRMVCPSLLQVVYKSGARKHFLAD